MSKMNFYDDSELRLCSFCGENTRQSWNYKVGWKCWSCVARKEEEEKQFKIATFAKVQKLLNLTNEEMRVLFKND